MSTIDPRTLELIASKICHDMISPIGAINNGLEILEEMGPDAGQDVIDLIASSAEVASGKLQVYRMAYGAGGADGNIRLENVYDAIEKILKHDARLSQDWTPSAGLGSELLPQAFCKILISTMLLALDCLPKGGVISVEAGEGNTTHVLGKGENAFIKDSYAECLSHTADLKDLSPSATHVFITGLLAKHYNYTITFSEDQTDVVRFTIHAPDF